MKTRYLPLLLFAALECQAQWTFQTNALHAGWNAIYVHVAPSTNSTLRQLVESDPANPVDQVWLWQPTTAGQQFVTSPSEPTTPSTQWKSWKRGSSDQLENTLNSLPANSAFLVHLPPATSYSWKITGRPVPPRYQWTTSGLNFLGFPTPPGAAPTFQSFLAAQPALRQSAEIFQYDGDRTPFPLFALSSTLVRRGEAFWIRSGDFFNRYFGPFEVILQNQDGVHFGDGGGQYRVRLRNLTPNPVQVVTTYRNGEAAVPGGEEAIAGLPPILVRGPRSTVDLTYGFRELTGPITNTLAPNGQEGFEAEMILGVDRSQLAGNPGALFAGILTLRDQGGLSHVELPVTARPASLGGLWIGNALVSQVRHYLVAPVRGPDGQNASDASPLVLPAEVTDLDFWAEAVNAAATPLTQWLAGQLSSSTRLELANHVATTFGVETVPGSRFGLGDILDLSGLVTFLNGTAADDPKGAFRDWLRGRLPASTQEMLALHGAPELDPRNLRAALIDALNGLVMGPPIHDAAVFAGVVLSGDTRALLLSEPPSGNPALARLNRRLLDDALAGLVTTKREGLRTSLTADINRLVYGPLVYRPERFEGIVLSADALRLVNEKPQGEALAYVNRLLLEEALPTALSKNARQYQFRATDVRSLDSVVGKLRSRQAGDIYSFLWDQHLDVETRDAVLAHGTDAAVPGLVGQLVGNLTVNTLPGPSLYTPERFALVPLSTETQALRLQNPTGADLRKLNRMLIEDAFPGAIAPSYGRMLVTTPRDDFGSVARPFPLRLIVHNDDASTNVSLLQRVYLGRDVAGTTVAATRESILNRTNLSTARRISAPQLPFSEGNVPWVFEGALERGGVLKVTVRVSFDDQAANPFLHTYHPDHDNRNAFFDEELPRGQESYGVEREITLSVAEPPTDFDARTVGYQALSGTYGEVIRVQGRQHPGSLRPDEIRTFEVRGNFALNRVLPDVALATQP